MIINAAFKMFGPPTAAIFKVLFIEDHSSWTENLGGNAMYNKSTHPYMHLLVTSHKKSSVHGHESFKIDSSVVYGTGCPKMWRNILTIQQYLQLVEHPEIISWPYVPDSALQI